MRFFERLSSLLAGLLVFILVAVTAVSVFARYVLDSPIPWTEEFSGLLMIWIVFLGAIGCEARNEHLTIDIFSLLLPDRPRRLLALAVATASACLLALMAWIGSGLAISATVKETRLLGISWFWIDIPVVIGALGIAVVVVWRIVRTVLGRIDFEESGLADRPLVAVDPGAIVR